MVKILLFPLLALIMADQSWANIGNFSHSLSTQRSNVKSQMAQSSKQKNSRAEIMAFYTEQNFPTNLMAEIHGQVAMAASAITDSDIKRIFPDQCDMVIDQVAQVVHEEITDTLLDEAKDIAKACPQWANLTRDEKKDFYVALITSMALAESGCNNRAVNRGAPEGRAYGLWQAPKPLSPVAGARWTLAKLDQQVSSSGLLFWANSRKNYWAVLNPRIHAHKVKKILKKIPSCVAQELTKWEDFQ